MDKDNLKSGTIVYYENRQNGSILEARVAGFFGSSVGLKELNLIDRDGNKYKSFRETLVYFPLNRLDRLYGTAEEAYGAKYARMRDQVEAYKGRIQNLDDLLNFLPGVMLETEESVCSEAALEAYCELCKELQGVEIHRQYEMEV